MIFKDKVYDEMDDISKMIEPYEYSVNAEISQMPDEIELSAEEIMTIKPFDGDVTITYIIATKARELNLNALADSIRTLSISFYKLCLERDGEEVQEGFFDVDSETMTAKIILRKIKDTFEEKELIQIGKESVSNQFYLLASMSARRIDKPRLNELAQLFNCSEALKERAAYKKINLLKNKVLSMMEDKTLDIRDIDLAGRFGSWFKMYVQHGNLAALTNLTKIKIVSHNQQPIYSIEESPCV